MKYTLTIESDDPQEIARLIAPENVTNSPAPVEDEPTDNATPPDADKRGMPWDERIHAASKALNKDGTWRYKRNTEQSLIDEVEAELQSVTPVMSANIQVPVANVAQAAAPSVTYEQVISELTEAMKTGKIAPEALPGFYEQCGVDGVHGLVDNQPALDIAHAKIAGWS